MTGVTRVGDLCTGHDNCPAVPLVTGSPNVFIEDRAVGRIGDSYAPHQCSAHESHVGVITSGNSSVLVNGLAIATVGDSVSCGGTVAEGSTSVIIGTNSGADYAIEMVFNSVRAMLESEEHSEGEEIVLATPDIAMNMAQKQSNEWDKQGWLYLSKMLRKWLIGKAYTITAGDRENGKATILDFYPDWSWFTNYTRFNLMYQTFVSSGALSDLGRESLIGRLKDHPSWEKGGDFDFSTEDKKDWEKYYFNYVSIPRSFIFLDGMDACLASHTIRALAAGHIEAFNDDNIKYITVNKLYVFVHDVFNFDGADSLYFWSKKELDFNTFQQDDSYYNLNNVDFNNFRKNHSRGGDYLVLSDLHECTEFSVQAFYTK